MSDPESAPHILVVEDDATLALGLEINLRAEGFRVSLARDGVKGLRLARDGGHQLVVLDLMLPGEDGFSILTKLRAEGNDVPVLVLTARSELEDKVKGLSAGADDYLTKPFQLEELTARVEALLRRFHWIRRRQNQLRLGDVVVDLEARTVARAAAPVDLTQREFGLLEQLLRNPGRTYSRAQLLGAVWGRDYEGTERTVDNFVRSLRVKLERDPSAPRHIVTVRGAGYRYDE
jgi:DNA-binding response OmpR family regulator